MSIGRATFTLTDPTFGGTGTNTWAIRFDGGFTDGEGAANAVVAIIGAWYTAVKYAMPATAHVHFNGELHGLAGDEGSTMQIDAFNADGQQAGGTPSPLLCLCTSWRAETGGRSGRGRTFLGPVAMSSLTANGTPDDTTLTTMRNAAAGLVSSNAQIQNGAVAIWSTKDNVARDIVAGTVKDQWASLRSRRD